MYEVGLGSAEPSGGGEWLYVVLLLIALFACCYWCSSDPPSKGYVKTEDDVESGVTNHDEILAELELYQRQLDVLLKAHSSHVTSLTAPPAVLETPSPPPEATAFDRMAPTQHVPAQWLTPDAQGFLKIQLERASRLPSGDSNGLSDPYVILSAGGQTKRSQTKWKTLEPEWNESIMLSGTLGDFLRTGLSLKVMDKDMLSKDDHLGDAQVSLKEIEQTGHHDYTEALTTHGTISFQARRAASTQAHPHVTSQLATPHRYARRICRAITHLTPDHSMYTMSPWCAGDVARKGPTQLHVAVECRCGSCGMSCSVCQLSSGGSRHALTVRSRLSFSRAAATRSLSLSCLFTAPSDACFPGVTLTSTLKRGGRERNSFTRMHSPISVAMLQCGIVGVKLMLTRPRASSTSISSRCATRSSSSVCGCSGSLMVRIMSKTSKASIGSRAAGSASRATSSFERDTSEATKSSGLALRPAIHRRGHPVGLVPHRGVRYSAIDTRTVRPQSELRDATAGRWLHAARARPCSSHRRLAVLVCHWTC